MSLIIELRVAPSSSKNNWVIDKSGMLKCFIKSPPVDGKANKELIKTIANTLKIPQHAVEIVQGLTNKKKRVKIDTTLSFDQFLQLLGIEKQLPLF